MDSEIKTRNLRNEGRYTLCVNAAVLFAVAVAAFAVCPEFGPIGHRTMITFDAIYAVLSVFFMYLLEKYTVSVSGLYEKTVITTLSGLYSFIVMSVLNLLFFTEWMKIAFDAVFSIIGIVSVAVSDVITERVFRRSRKPRLLIIDSGEKNFFRMKKIKYGVPENYDAWYESVNAPDERALEEFIESEFPQYDAICIFDSLPEAQYDMAVNAAMEMNKELFVVPKIIDVGKTNAQTVLFDDIMTLYIPKQTLNKAELFLKRAVDIIVSLVGLVIAAVPMAVIAAAIKISSPGPVFYKQVRLTRNKREFEIYKFRTMIPDAEKLSGPKFAEKDDPRITPIGKLLRACRLDELPQLINILKNDMSLVGPRPERPMFVKKFENEIEDYDHRFEVKAGLTSLSHVYGKYSTYIYDRTYYDLYYIVHYSILLDFKIMLLTTKTIFMKSAAEGEDSFKQSTSISSRTEVETQ